MKRWVERPGIRSQSIKGHEHVANPIRDSSTRDHRHFTDVAVVWSRGFLCCRLATNGERFRVYIIHGSEVLKFEEYRDPAQALATGWLWRDPM